ncbi:MAG TPA: hypothetical protein VK071_11350 [Tissierellales bacterium]|nr:hypothetical protein [Tissierellales bacterium]
MNIIILLFFFSIFNERKDLLDFNKNFAIDVDIDVQDTKDRLNIMRKITPYFPKEYIPIVNKSILLTTKVLAIYQTKTFIETGEPFTPVKYKEVENNKERLNYIVTTLKQEVPDENLRSLITNLEMIINIDKYKDMFFTLNNIMTNSEKAIDIDKLLTMAKPFIENTDEDQKDQLLNMAKMLQK